MATVMQGLKDSSGRQGDNTAVFTTIFFHLDLFPLRCPLSIELNGGLEHGTKT
jgi:hypothetical protein